MLGLQITDASRYYHAYMSYNANDIERKMLMALVQKPATYI